MIFLLTRLPAAQLRTTKRKLRLLRAFWQALTRDRRFAGRGFKRHEPVGRHIPDVVSFPLRLIIELVPADENETARAARAERRAWLEDVLANPAGPDLDLYLGRRFDADI